ncbi:MAG: universal stress protein [Candidatus Promineifilaceae bacterium]|nr:universal stress protein [Candidatus Promineifilaceae bacterium]
MMHILMATEGAAHSDVVIRLGAEIARATESTLTILTVIEDEGEQPEAEGILERAESLVGPAVSGVEVLIRHGAPADTIVTEASEGDYDLAIVGERPLHILRRRLFTQTAEKVIAEMPCPILVARHQSRPLRRFLICESGRDPELLKGLTGRLAPLLRSADEVEVLHVMSQMVAAPGVPGWEIRAEADELMDADTPEGAVLEHGLESLEELEALDVRVTAKVRHGMVVEEILDEATHGDFDVVVVGAHEVSGWRRLLVDDPVRQILLYGDRPILII